jgi:hypothetical protein
MWFDVSRLPKIQKALTNATVTVTVTLTVTVTVTVTEYLFYERILKEHEQPIPTLSQSLS